MWWVSRGRDRHGSRGLGLSHRDALAEHEWSASGRAATPRRSEGRSPLSDAGGQGVFKSSPSPLASPPPVAEPPILSSTTTPIIEADPLPELQDRQLGLPVRGAVRRELRDSFYDTRRLTHSHEAIDIMGHGTHPFWRSRTAASHGCLRARQAAPRFTSLIPQPGTCITTPISGATLTGSKRAITFNAGRCSATSALPATRPKVCPTRARTVLYSGRWAVRAAEVPF
jgi:hypothetical protein